MNAVLRQKAGAGKQVQETRAMSPARAFRLALTRAGTPLGLAVGAETGEARQVPQVSAVDAVSDMALTLRLARGDGQPGVLSVDAPLLASLIECQTLGRVLDRPPPDRAATDTDAALLHPFAQAVLRDLPAEDHAGAALRVEGRVARPGLLDALLTQPAYMVFSADLDLAGLRKGRAVMVLPLPAGGASGAETPGARPGKPRLAPAVDAPAALHVALCRIRRPLSAVRGLKVGDTLTLPHGALNRARLEFGDAGAGVEVQLGRLNGYRAVRFGPPVAAEDPAPAEPAPPEIIPPPDPPDAPPPAPDAPAPE